MSQSVAIIIPCHNEFENVPLIYQALKKTFQTDLPQLEPQIWYVNDGSTDDTLAQVQHLQENDAQVHYIDLSRSFGKEAAMYAGLVTAKADYYAVMDADLQDPPAMLPDMYAALQEGYDMAGAQRTDRSGEARLRSFFSNLFYKFINRVSQTQIVSGARDFRLMTRQVADAIVHMTERNRFSKGLFSWVGFKTKYLPYQNIERQHGETSWSFTGLLRYAIDGIIDFSDAPLTFVSMVGIISFLGAFAALIFIVIRAALYGDPTAGWPSMVSIFLMIGGIQLFALGIVGRYIGRIYIETKQRPIFIARKIK
ncbi:glycosyltransferase family 2 protein [Lacticaseibacillus chiayiensis]|uniref:glycosyltransferase family 2 protein n=1 Tax=Lacticaseibacillus chiayiensis TaxID=2100821 RepID=UPI001010897C|nr:glycosyltransferase family 2 protein [Lacticaseibacillus chiayiensis]RXT58871.1 glycosyltransferase [Lacticaseibacillus chiayiensis]